jgi:hypothetical protein
MRLGGGIHLEADGTNTAYGVGAAAIGATANAGDGLTAETIVLDTRMSHFAIDFAPVACTVELQLDGNVQYRADVPLDASIGRDIVFNKIVITAGAIASGKHQLAWR